MSSETSESGRSTPVIVSEEKQIVERVQRSTLENLIQILKEIDQARLQVREMTSSRLPTVDLNLRSNDVQTRLTLFRALDAVQEGMSLDSCLLQLEGAVGTAIVEVKKIVEENSKPPN